MDVKSESWVFSFDPFHGDTNHVYFNVQVEEMGTVISGLNQYQGDHKFKQHNLEKDACFPLYDYIRIIPDNIYQILSDLFGSLGKKKKENSQFKQYH